MSSDILQSNVKVSLCKPCPPTAASVNSDVNCVLLSRACQQMGADAGSLLQAAISQRQQSSGASAVKCLPSLSVSSKWCFSGGCIVAILEIQQSLVEKCDLGITVRYKSSNKGRMGYMSR